MVFFSHSPTYALSDGANENDSDNRYRGVIAYRDYRIERLSSQNRGATAFQGSIFLER